MGITSPLDGIPAEGIGGLRIGVSPLEMADAYATLASGGIRHDPVAIDRVVFPDGKVDEPERPRPQRVISEAVAYEVTRLLHDNIIEGTGTAAYTGCEGQAGRRAPPTASRTPGSPAISRTWRPRSGSATRESNEIEMTSVHGIAVFGGTFPAEIWHSLYSEREIPCEDFQPAAEPDHLGAVHRPVHARRADRRLHLRRRPRRRRDPSRPGSGRRLLPERLRTGRRTGTVRAAAAAAARRVGGGERDRRRAPADRREAAS